MEFKEVKTNIDKEHSWYCSYRDNSVGRVLHYLYHYLGLHVADSVQVSNKQVTYHGKVIADIDWSGGYPLFNFQKINSSLHEEQIQHATKKQQQLVIMNEK